MDNIQFHKSSNVWFKFDAAFDLNKEICKLSITNPTDIAILCEKYRECLKLQDSNEETPTWDRPYFHEGASFTAYGRMKEAFELFKKGAMMAPFQIRITSGTAIHIDDKAYKTAINAKIYDLEEYNECISQYNLKRGLMLTDLDFDGDLSAGEVETLCDGLKTYEAKDIFPQPFLNKVKMEYYGKIEVEENNNAQ